MDNIDDFNRLILQLREEFAGTKRRLAALLAEERGTQAQVEELEETRRALHRLGDELEGAKRMRNLHIAWMKRRPA